MGGSLGDAWRCQMPCAPPNRPNSSVGPLRRPAFVASRPSRGRPGRGGASSQSRSAHIVVRNAIPDHGMASGAKVPISSASGVGAAVPPTILRLERDRHDGRLQARVEPDDLARLDEQSGLLPGLADGRLVDGLVDLEEAAGLRPRPRPGSMPRRSSTSSPSSVIGSVVTTSRGLT